MTREEKIELIVEKEWESFQKVRNIGGRASCQEDPETFFVMRRSHHLPWPEILLDSYLKDLNNAEAAGRNLLTEKYARMMKDTAPEEYESLEEHLPPVSPLSEAIIAEAVATEMKWMAAYQQAYPYLAGGNRVLRKEEAQRGQTSFETYLAGELMTYSETTLQAYRQMLCQLEQEGRNLFMLVMEAQVKAYGYRSLEEANEKMKGETR